MIAIRAEYSGYQPETKIQENSNQYAGVDFEEKRRKYKRYQEWLQAQQRDEVEINAGEIDDQDETFEAEDSSEELSVQIKEKSETAIITNQEIQIYPNITSIPQVYELTAKEINEEEVKDIEEVKLVAYNVLLDIESYAKIDDLKVAFPETYEEKIKHLDEYIHTQFNTYLGERYRVGLSQWNYEIKDGQLYGKGNDKPFIEVIEMGIEERQGKSTEDDKRHDAEREGFIKMQSTLTDKNTPINTTMLSISPPSGSYKRNFYDIFTLQENEEGAKYVAAGRYSSALRVDEYIEKVPFLLGLEENKEINLQREVTPSDFLANPLIVSFESPEKVHEFLHKDHEHLRQEEFEQIKEVAKPYIDKYIEAIKQNTQYQKQDISLKTKQAFNTILNKTEDAAKLLKINTNIDHLKVNSVSDSDIEVGGYTPTQRDSDCGEDGAFSINGEGDNSNNTAFSVAEFGENNDKYGKRTFKCPACNRENKRPYNQLLLECQFAKEKNRPCPRPSAVRC